MSWLRPMVWMSTVWQVTHRRGRSLQTRLLEGVQQHFKSIMELDIVASELHGITEQTSPISTYGYLISTQQNPVRQLQDFTGRNGVLYVYILMGDTQ